MKVLLLGDPGIGKRSLRYVLKHNDFPRCQSQLIWINAWVDHYDYTAEGIQVQFCVFEAREYEAFDILRKIAIWQRSWSLILCFSIIDINSLRNLEEKLHSVATHLHPETAIVLLGLKSDLRDDVNNEHNIVNYETGLQMARQLKALQYFEISSLTDGKRGIETLLRQIIKLALEHSDEMKKKKQKNKCEII